MTTSFGGVSMARTRRYHPRFAEDLAAAVGDYDDISVDLGNRFRAAVRDRLETITHYPEAFGRIHEQLRATLINRFWLFIG